MFCGACCGPAAPDEASEHREAPARSQGVTLGQHEASPTARSAGSSPQRGGGAGPGLDQVLSDLETVEGQVYGQAFQQIPGSSDNLLPLSSEELRNFLAVHTAIEQAELETELLKTGALDEGGLSQDRFVQMLRDNAVADTSAIEEFLGASNDGVTLPSMDCRSRLLLMFQRQLDADFTEDQWDRTFNTVMMDADVVVPMEQWIAFCKQTARIVRVMKLGQVL